MAQTQAHALSSQYASQYSQFSQRVDGGFGYTQGGGAALATQSRDVSQHVGGMLRMTKIHRVDLSCNRSGRNRRLSVVAGLAVVVAAAAAVVTGALALVQAVGEVV